MTKKVKKTLKMGQKTQKMSPIIKKSCYFVLKVGGDIIRARDINKPPSKSVLGENLNF